FVDGPTSNLAPAGINKIHPSALTPDLTTRALGAAVPSNKALQDRLTRLLAGNATLKLVKKTRKTRETAELRLQLDDAVERIKLLEAQPHGPALVADLQVELEITSARADAFEKEMEASRIELNATLTKLEIAQEACRTSGVHGQQSD